MTTTDGPSPIATKGFVLRHAQARWYDLLAAALTLGRDRQLRERMAELARLAPGEAVLDVGCGTGTLALAAKRAVGETGRVTGVDASPEMIALAARKAGRAGADVGFRVTVAERLPFADASFDVVLSTLMLHHLPAPLRRECVREARRVLSPGGRILVADFGAPSPRRNGLLSRLHRHGGVPLGQVVTLLRDAGFRVEETGPVGLSDLQYALAVVPDVGTPASEPVVPATRTLPPLPVSRWIVSAVGLGVFALHALTGQQIISRVTLSAGGIAIAALGVAVVIGHLVRRRPIR